MKVSQGFRKPVNRISSKMNYFIYTSHHFTPHGRYELNKLTSLPICGFIAQLVEQRTGNAEVTSSNPVEALIFFRLLFSNCLNWKIYCDNHSSLSSTTAVQKWIISHILHIRISSVNIFESYYFLVDSWLIDSATHLQLILFLCFQLTSSPPLIKPNQFPIHMSLADYRPARLIKILSEPLLNRKSWKSAPCVQMKIL